MIYLHGMGHYHPPTQIDNAFLESLEIGSNSDWIMERVGIKIRRTVLPLEYIRKTKNKDTRAAIEAATHSNAETGALAAKMALQRAGITAKDVGMVISSSCIPDTSCPSEAATIAGALGIECLSFDVNSACSSFGVCLDLLSRMREETLPSYVLIVNVENMTKVVDYSSRNTAALWGDGSSAAVISTTEPSALRITNFSSNSSPSGCDNIKLWRWDHFQQNGKAVQNFAIRQMTSAVKSLQDDCDMKQGRFIFIGHQANYTMLESVCRRSKIDKANHWHSVTEFGNTGSSGAPGVLSLNYDKLRKQDQLAFSVVGAGLTWSSFKVEVSEKFKERTLLV